MPKLIRKTYPAQFSVGLLSLIFVISSLLSFQIFTVSFNDLDKNPEVFLGMFLIGCAVVIMLLIIWEEILFPIKVKETENGMIFRNHRTKLKTQLLIFCTIPAIFIFIFLEYEVKLFRFLICAAVCIIAPLIEKIASGINNYNDFLKLTDSVVEYKNNEKEGSYLIKDIKKIFIGKDERSDLIKMQLLFIDDAVVDIDLDEMELDAYYDAINEYVTTHYIHLIKEKKNIDVR